MLAMTSDYRADHGDPTAHLEQIARSGFRAVHWCHHWRDDFLYTEPEIRYLEGLFRKLGLRMFNVHASQGEEKSYSSLLEQERQAGAELLRNRLLLTARTGGDTLICHAPAGSDAPRSAAFRRSLEEVRPVAGQYGVRIALENLTACPLAELEEYLQDFPPDFLGICYDSGHGNLAPDGGELPRLQAIRQRLIALHLHDNDGSGDQHRLLFEGTVDWPQLAAIVADSPCREKITLECNQRHYQSMPDEEYLRRACQGAERFAALVAARALRTPPMDAPCT